MRLRQRTAAEGCKAAGDLQKTRKVEYLFIGKKSGKKRVHTSIERLHCFAMVEIAHQVTLVYVYVALAIVCMVLWLLRRYRLRRSSPASAIPSDPPTRDRAAPVQVIAPDASATWDSHAEVQQLLTHSPELCRLYATLGYAPEFEPHCMQLLHELTALISTEVQDFGAFYSTVHDVQAQLATLEHGAPPHDLLARERLQKARHDPLWQAVLAAGQDREQVLALLNRDPVHEQLPFIEQIPLAKDGQVVWRTPVEVALVRKRPRDTERFSQVLDALETLFTAPRVLLHPQARQQVLDAMARVRRDVQRPDGYLPTRLQALAEKIALCVHQALNSTAHRRREALDRLLEACVTVRHTYACGSAQGSTRAETTVACFRRAAQQHAQYYLNNAWMHTPCLTVHVLTNLLDSDLAPWHTEAQRMTDAGARRLTLIRDEVASGRYDGDEIIRRLRQQEEQGVYVHSLIYPLLRLPTLGP